MRTAFPGERGNAAQTQMALHLERSPLDPHLLRLMTNRMTLSSVHTACRFIRQEQQFERLQPLAPGILDGPLPVHPAGATV